MRPTRLLVPFTAALLASAAPAAAQSGENFNRIATFHVADNLPGGADPKAETVAEILAATEDGMTLVATDSPGERIGLIDITDPTAPKAAGMIALNGEPTSVVVAAGKALVGVTTSESKAKPSGHLAIVDLAAREVVGTCDLGGQPDSLAKSPDGTFLAIAIENERDEDLNDGALPQLPGGNLSTFRIGPDGGVDCATRKIVDLSGLAAVAPEDPEPEYVDVNARNEAVVTLQENNHVVVVDLASGKATAHFPAGAVDLAGIDTKKDKVIDATGSAAGVLREPDAVQWLDETRFVTANEGDWKGGSRGFTIFSKDGAAQFESRAALDHLALRLGHYPEDRNKKGAEPEGAEVATFGSDRLIFIALERASLVAVYKDEGAGQRPTFLQALPGGIGPEGVLAIPARGLLVTASETDLRADGSIGSVVTLYRREPKPAAYPTLVSADGPDGTPIPWAAISGATADRTASGVLHAVTDSAHAQGRILTIDTTKNPAVISGAKVVTRDGKPAERLDLEGIAAARDGGFWLASEGDPRKETRNLLLKVSAEGAIEQEIPLPESIAGNAVRFGLEGVAITGSEGDETVWLAVQRAWKDDPKGKTKLLAYKPATKSWGVVHYQLDTAEKGWVGLSEITAVGNGLVVIERDNQIGRDATIKRLTYVPLEGVSPAAPGAKEIPTVTKQLVRDLVPDLAAPAGFVLDKIESFAVNGAGEAFVITDNDGVDDHSGETQFLRLGKLKLPN